MKRITPIIGLIVVIVLSILFDYWIELLRQQTSSTFNQFPRYWIGSILNLVFIAALVALAWLVIIREGKSNLIAIMFVISGLLLILYFPAVQYNVPGFPQFFSLIFKLARKSALLIPLYHALLSTSLTFFHLAGAGIFIIEIIGLIWGKRDQALIQTT